ncbi:phosphoribosyltransferase family protein [Ammonicoccus fulvus]|uniref:Phosphoribosyltransferase family protein n=1 Tax=Ammonicoccus fulvus TaxID=3138240 RepID=A0ABZ3FMF1_9ACTN
MSDLLDHAADLLLGSRCPGCHQPGRSLCAACRQRLAGGRVRFVERDPSPVGFPLTVCAGDYTGVMPALLSGFKDERLLDLATPLAARLGASVMHLLAALGRVGSAYALVPVTSSPAAIRERGLDHTHLLATRAARLVRREVGLALPVRRLVQPPRRAVDQVGLDAVARLRNRRNHYAAVPAPRGEIPILVDDVTTTGSTLAAAARALADSGSPALGAVVVAATVRRSPSR